MIEKYEASFDIKLNIQGHLYIEISSVTENESK